MSHVTFASTTNTSLVSTKRSLNSNASLVPNLISNYPGPGPSLESSAWSVPSVPHLLSTFLNDCLNETIGPSSTLDRLCIEGGNELYELAQFSLNYEEHIQTKCFIIQALTLVRYWWIKIKKQTNNQIKGEQEESIIQWIRHWYYGQSSNLDDHNRRHRMIEWRASFAIKIYNSMNSPYFHHLLHAILNTHISSLRLLQMRFWKDEDLSTFPQILQFVSHHHLTKHDIEGIIWGWNETKEISTGVPLINQFSNNTNGSSFIVNELAHRLETYMKEKQTQKLLRKAQSTLSLNEIEAMKQLQHISTSTVQEQPTDSAVSTISNALLQDTSTDVQPNTTIGSDLLPTMMIDVKKSFSLSMSVGQVLEDSITEVDQNSSINIPAASSSPTSSLSPVSSLINNLKFSSHYLRKRNKREEITPSKETTVSDLETDPPMKKSRGDWSTTVGAAAASTIHDEDESIDDDTPASNSDEEVIDSQMSKITSVRPSPHKRRKTTNRQRKELTSGTTTSKKVRTIGETQSSSTISNGVTVVADSKDLSVTDPMVLIVPKLRAPLIVPLEILSLGVSSWMRKRCQSTTNISHQTGVDNELSEMMWELADQLTDGERLDIPEFQQARRSPSRSASARYNIRMEGERQCTIILRILQTQSDSAVSHPSEEDASLCRPSKSNLIRPESSIKKSHDQIVDITAAATLASNPLDLDPAVTWDQYGYALLPATDESRELAKQMLEMERPSKVKEKEQIAGNVTQYDLSNHNQFINSSLSFKWRKCVLNAVKQFIGVGLFTILALLHLITPKLLVAQPGDGLQTVHWDHIEGYESPEDNITVILYCADTKSTAVPRFPKGTIIKDQASCQYLQSMWYHSINVKAGDMLIFQQRTPHLGVRNESEEDERVAFFGMFSQQLNPKQDQYQMFRWTFIAEVFGTDSKEYAQVLVEERKQHPLGRFKGKALQTAQECLEKHGLTAAYYA